MKFGENDGGALRRGEREVTRLQGRGVGPLVEVLHKLAELLVPAHGVLLDRRGRLAELVDAVLRDLRAARRDVEELLAGPLVKGPAKEKLQSAGWRMLWDHQRTKAYPGLGSNEVVSVRKRGMKLHAGAVVPEIIHRHEVPGGRGLHFSPQS